MSRDRMSGGGMRCDRGELGQHGTPLEAKARNRDSRREDASRFSFKGRPEGYAGCSRDIEGRQALSLMVHSGCLRAQRLISGSP